jgi:hypothetical protein
LKKSARNGPLTENHLQVLRLLCRPDLYLEPAAAAMNSKYKQLKHPVPDTGEQDRDRQATLQSENSIQSDKEMKETGSPCIGQDSNLPVLKIVELLEKFELQPSYLLHEECREVLEANLIHRQSQGPLSPEQLAILQLLSKAEIDSEMAPSPERRRVLEERMRQGPLSSSHLGAVAGLAKYDKGESLQEKVLLPAGLPADSETAITEISSTAAEHPEVAAPAKGEPTVENPVSSKTPFYDQTIAGLEIRSDRSALLSKEEKARMQQLELKIKTDRIRQSIPEWVRRGLLPPRKEIKPRKPDVALDSPVLISSTVRADLVYLQVVGTNPTVSPPKPRDLFHADGELFGPRPGYAPGPPLHDPGPAESGLAEVASPVAAQAALLAVQSEHAESPETENETGKQSLLSQLWKCLGRLLSWLAGRCCSMRSWSSS